MDHFSFPQQMNYACLRRKWKLLPRVTKQLFFNIKKRKRGIHHFPPISHAPHLIRRCFTCKKKKKCENVKKKGALDDGLLLKAMNMSGHGGGGVELTVAKVAVEVVGFLMKN